MDPDIRARAAEVAEATVRGGANDVAEMTTCGEHQQEGDPDGVEVDMEGVAKQAA
eukprot:CAMPEP_0117615534 /NCGR_PEP_ID=MMETSP0784-20121206/84589_1 /TAXON_ID=39447 /ORGANISM="" /LENGTH=54 /DNA_ID=CAMNT_0005419273 /DNA_START=73 /DNA_END=233 /DNA_ORIENTATION=+